MAMLGHQHVVIEPCEIPIGTQRNDVDKDRDDPISYLSSAIVRSSIYSHVAAVAVCSMFSLADCGQLLSPVISEAVIQSSVMSPFFLASLLGWFVCPITALVTVSSTRLSLLSKLLVFGVEFLLCIAQAYAILPAVM